MRHFLAVVFTFGALAGAMAWWFIRHTRDLDPRLAWCAAAAGALCAAVMWGVLPNRPTLAGGVVGALLHPVTWLLFNATGRTGFNLGALELELALSLSVYGWLTLPIGAVAGWALGFLDRLWSKGQYP